MANRDKTGRIGFVIQHDDKTIYIYSDKDYMDNIQEGNVWHVKAKRKKVEKRNSKTKGD
jgi:L-ascorbate metabolism protein UlaG (beta-lactamase superfamily)